MESFCPSPPLSMVLPSSVTSHVPLLAASSSSLYSLVRVFLSRRSLPLLSCSPLSLVVSQPGRVFSLPVKNWLPNESAPTELGVNDGAGLIQTPVKESC